MDKRIIAIVLALIITVSALAACGAEGGSGGEAPEATETDIGGIEVRDQPYKDALSNKVYLIMTNHTGEDCDIKVSISFSDSNGDILETSENTTFAVAGGATVAEPFYCESSFDSYSYEVEAVPLSLYKPVDGDLEMKVSDSGDKVGISVTNNGAVTAGFVEYHALFYKNNEMVGYDWGYCVDDDSEIKPGATAENTAECKEEYDRAEVYIHGKAI